MLKRPRSEISRALAACLDPEAGRRVLAKDLAGPYIAPQRRNGLVTRLLHDDELVNAVHRGLRDAECPERMPAERPHPQSHPAGCTLEELADRIPVQAAPRYMTVSSNGTEDRAFSNRGPVEPVAQRPDWASILTRTEGQTHFPSGALLVCLRFADGDDHAVGREFQVTYIDAGQLRPAKSSRKSDQDKCGVPKAEKVFTAGGDNPADVRRKERGLSVLRGADGAPDSLEGFADDEVAGRGRRVGEACGLMRFGNRGKPAADADSDPPMKAFTARHPLIYSALLSAPQRFEPMQNKTSAEIDCMQCEFSVEAGRAASRFSLRSANLM